MSWTKRELIKKAFEKAGLATYYFDLNAEQLDGALVELDAMMAEWAQVGLPLGYVTPDTPDGSELDDLSGIPNWANSAVYLNLAPRISGDFGKVVAQTTLVAARQSMEAVYRQVAQPQPVPYPSTMLGGAGNYRRRPLGPIADETAGRVDPNFNAGDYFNSLLE